MADRWQTVWAVADGWERLALVALVVATVAQTLFILIYGSRPWWRARVGQALFLKSATLCLVLWLTLIGAFYLMPEWLPSLAMCAVSAAIVYQLVVLMLSPRNPNA